MTATLHIDLSDPATRDARTEAWRYLANMGIVPAHRVDEALRKACLDDLCETAPEAPE